MDVVGLGGASGPKSATRQTMHPARPHEIDSPYVTERLALRAREVNGVRTRPHGEFVLYWMQSTQRLEDNWALRLAVLEADRLGRPLLILQQLDSGMRPASARHHTFILEGARELQHQAAERGYSYAFLLLEAEAEGPSAELLRQVIRTANRANMVVTDDFPTADVPARTQIVAEHAGCRVVAVDSAGVVPVSLFPGEEYAARTIRPKLFSALPGQLDVVQDRPSRLSVNDGLRASLELPALDLARTGASELAARCAVDHEVAPVSLCGGASPARARLEHFVSTGLRDYRERRSDPNDDDGSSRLSPWLHFGMISPAAVVRAAVAAGASLERGGFVDELVTWRELSLNFCTRNARFAQLRALPRWVHDTMSAHQDDQREVIYTRATLDRARTGSDLWNASQCELRSTGVIHNVTRMLWGKSVLLWTRRYGDALRSLIAINDRWALDGSDPNSYAGIQWCFGKFDRPFAERAVWGKIRPMSLQRARAKFDVSRYVRRWLHGHEQPEQAELL
jgi:deoxyribodipyrimidine photo-lyase